MTKCHRLLRQEGNDPRPINLLHNIINGYTSWISLSLSNVACFDVIPSVFSIAVCDHFC